MFDKDIEEKLEVLEKEKEALETQKAELLAKRKAYDDQVEVINGLQNTMNQAFDAQKAAIARELGIDVSAVKSEPDNDEPVNGIRRPTSPLAS